MTDLVYDYISMGVDMIITATILATVIVVLRSSVELSSYQADLTANSERVNYYRQYNKYDLTTNLSAADVIGALTYFRYDLEIYVFDKASGGIYNDPDTGEFYTFTVNAAGVITKGSKVEASALPSKLKAEKKYSSALVEDNAKAANTTNYQGGVITGIKFTEQ